jgi:hypothetical protein
MLIEQRQRNSSFFISNCDLQLEILSNEISNQGYVVLSGNEIDDYEVDLDNIIVT